MNSARTVNLQLGQNWSWWQCWPEPDFVAGDRNAILHVIMRTIAKGNYCSRTCCVLAWNFQVRLQCIYVAHALFSKKLQTSTAYKRNYAINKYATSSAFCTWVWQKARLIPLLVLILGNSYNRYVGASVTTQTISRFILKDQACQSDRSAGWIIGKNFVKHCLYCTAAIWQNSNALVMRRSAH